VTKILIATNGSESAEDVAVPELRRRCSDGSARARRTGPGAAAEAVLHERRRPVLVVRGAPVYAEVEVRS
jgi:hypothetical protein